MRRLTRLRHLQLGRICLDILKDKWSPALQIRTVLLRCVNRSAARYAESHFQLTLVFTPHSIQALLSAPNPDDPLAENIAKHWKENEQEAVATGAAARRWHHFYRALWLLPSLTQRLRHTAREWARLYAQP